MWKSIGKGTRHADVVAPYESRLLRIRWGARPGERALPPAFLRAFLNVLTERLVKANVRPARS
jgi:hypothetical protein